MADRYTGRHIRQARHGAWLSKKRSRSRPSRQLLPTAAALTVAGVLIGGAGAVMQFNPTGRDTGADLASGYDPADYAPPDREAAAGRVSRNDVRPATAPTVAPPAKPSRTTDRTPEPPPGAAVASTGSCDASYHDDHLRTASGDTSDPEALTAAHKGLPFDSQVRVTSVATGQSVIVRINDRGPFVAGRCLDLSKAAFDTIADLRAGVIDVRYEVLVEDAT